jgi:acyl-CoA reductase-like NAD-dependent aldehyde dehydrogenase
LNKDEKVKTVNPATEEVLNEYQIMTKQQQINDKARKARNAFDEWKKDAARESISFMILPIN